MALETLGVGAVIAWLGKDGMQRVLGPTADYLGGELKDFAQKRIGNVKSILQNAENKIPEELHASGSVPPKVLRAVLNEGSYSSDDVMVEYFGGILASSKSEQGRDDRGARLSLKMSVLSSYQLRAHFILYSCFHYYFKNKPVKLDSERDKLKFFIPQDCFIPAMGFDREESAQIDGIFSHIFHGLAQDGLIENDWIFGSKEYLTRDYLNVPSPGIIFTPNPSGIELLLWAFGFGRRENEFILNEAFEPKIEGIDINMQGVISLLELFKNPAT